VWVALNGPEPRTEFAGEVKEVPGCPEASRHGHGCLDQGVDPFQEAARVATSEPGQNPYDMVCEGLATLT